MRRNIRLNIRWLTFRRIIINRDVHVEKTDILNNVINDKKLRGPQPPRCTQRELAKLVLPVSKLFKP